MRTQGDATAAPRMRQASASASFVVHGPGCVGEGGAGETLSEGVELRVLVDGSEEAATSEAAVDVTLPDLSSGNHLLAALVVAQDARGERILASSASEVVILRDIEILFPSNDFVFASGQKVGPMRVYRQLAINIVQGKTHKGHCADSRVAMHTRRTRN